MIASELLRRAVSVGRMTYQDAAELTAVFVQVSSRQARDVLGAVERRARGGPRPPGAPDRAAGSGKRAR